MLIKLDISKGTVIQLNLQCILLVIGVLDLLCVKKPSLLLFQLECLSLSLSPSPFLLSLSYRPRTLYPFDMPVRVSKTFLIFNSFQCALLYYFILIFRGIWRFGIFRRESASICSTSGPRFILIRLHNINRSIVK